MWNIGAYSGGSHGGGQVVKKILTLSERLHETMHKLSARYADICFEAKIEPSSLSAWLNEENPEAYDFSAVESALESWIASKQPTASDEIVYAQIKAPYLKRLQISNGTATQWLESPNLNKVTVGDGPAEHFVPINIDIELDGQTYKDTIVWNIQEPYLNAENYAQFVARENRLSMAMEQEIANAIRRHLNGYRYYEAKDKEAIRQIELNILIDNVQLKDRFEWDINDASNSPEVFALNMCAELGLNGEFASRISFQIREQILAHQKSITERRLNVNQLHNLKKSTRSLIEASASYDQILNISTTVTPDNYLRPLIDDSEDQWEPKLSVLAQDDIRKLQKEEQRKQRILRRNR